MQLHFITNGVFSTSIAGGDIHFLKLAEGAAKYGYELNFFGGHALQEVIRKHHLPGTVTVTDAVKVTVCPKVEGFSDEFVIVVVVDAWFTVCVRAAEVAPR